MRVISINLNKDCTVAILEAITVLRRGGVIVYPTDTVYGLGANACDEWAVEQVFKIKNRPLTKPLPIVARNMKWVKELAFVPPKLEAKLEEIWPARLSGTETQAGKPGPTTVVLAKKTLFQKS